MLIGGGGGGQAPSGPPLAPVMAATFLRSWFAQTLSNGDEPRHSLHASAQYRK